MQWLAEVCVRRPVFAMTLVAAMIVAGIAAYGQLGIDRFPEMDLPTIFVFTNYPGASPNEVETEITQVLEDAVATVAGIDELRSLSRDGNSILIISFDLDRDIDVAAQDVRDAVASVANLLPPDTDPPVVDKADLDSSPILSLAVSGNRESRELYVLADRFVKNVVESAHGVSEVTIAGAMDRAIQVNIEARRLAAYQLSIMQVRDALARQNTDVPGGKVDAGTHELSLRTMGRVQDPEDFLDLVVSSPHGTPVRLRDLGDVRDASKEVRTLARLDGEPAVVCYIQRQSGTNTVEVIQAVKDRLDRCRALLPPDVQLQVIQDQSRYINAAMHEIQGHLISGSILASIVVLLFMRSWRSTLIAAVAIPGSIVATFAVMRWMNFTLNNVTMLALVLMVGVVIDDAIVVLENVYRFIEEKGMSPFQAAIEGTREIGLAVLATTLSLVIVFLPVSFLSSVTGRMLYQFGMTAVVAIMISMLISFSLTPMMCSRLLRPNTRSGDSAPRSRRGPYHWLEVAYVGTLRFAMRFRWLVLAVVVLVIASNYPLYKMVHQDYLPTNVDESEFEIRVTAQEGASLVAMDETSLRGRARAAADSRHRPLAHGGRQPPVGVAQQRRDLRARRGHRKTQLQHEAAVARAVGRAAHGRVRRQLLAARSDAAGSRPAGQVSRADSFGPQPDQPAPRRAGRHRFRHRRPGYRDAGPPERGSAAARREAARHRRYLYHAAHGHARAAGGHQSRAGCGAGGRRARDRRNAADCRRRRRPRVALSRRTRRRHLRRRAAAGRNRPREPRRDQPALRPQQPAGLGRSRAMSPEATAAAVTPTAHAAGPSLTRLDNVVRFYYAETTPRIDRVDRQRMAAVRANLGPGYALADRIDAFHKAAAEMGLPPGYVTRVAGRGRELERTFQDFGWTMILSFIFMYLVLAAQFEHLVHPLTILISLPLAIPFGLLSLLLGGETLNLYSALGILVLFGVVKKNAILQVDHTNQLRAEGHDRLNAILEANRDRLRPILMTTISFVAGLLPLLIAAGPGAEERRSIAVLAVGGQTLSLLLTLLATPVIYSIFDDMAKLFPRKASQLEPQTAPRAPQPPHGPSPPKLAPVSGTSAYSEN